MPQSLSRSALLALVFATIAAGPALAATDAEINGTIAKVLGHADLYENAVKSFQQAVAAGNKEDAAAFIRYPIPITINGKKRVIRSPTEFVKNYDSIMTPDIVAAVKNQNYGDLLVSSKGVMFGNGEVWITGMCLDRHCRTMIPVVVGIQQTGSN
jgi:hypothetical protein